MDEEKAMQSGQRQEVSLSIQTLAEMVQAQTEKVIVGKSRLIRLLIMSVLAGGHVLLDDYPGVGKTTLVRTISIALGCQMRRVQFVPDLLPSDITGMRIFNQKTGEFELRHGPVMTNLLLADEINRAIPRTQAALLEAMEEHQVSIDGECYPPAGAFRRAGHPESGGNGEHLPSAGGADGSFPGASDGGLSGRRGGASDAEPGGKSHSL